MKKTFAVAMFLALGAGIAGARAATSINIAGSDTLKQLTVAVLNDCPGATGVIAYIGGGSGAGENAMVNDFSKSVGQFMSPMSRFVAGAATANKCTAGACSSNADCGTSGGVCNAGVCSAGACTSASQCGTSAGACTPVTSGICQVDASKAEGIEIAGDDIGLWMTTAHQTACDPGSATDTCGGYTNGGLAFSTTLSTGLTLTSWKDVTRLVYFGLAPGAFNLPLSPTAVNDTVPGAAIARRNCQDPSRVELISHFGELFQNNCGGDTGECVVLRHAFRRDENSGTTDFFRETNNLESGTQFGTKGFPFCNEYVPAVTANAASQAVTVTTCTVASGTATASDTGCPAAGGANPYRCAPSSAGSTTGTKCQRPRNGCATGTNTADCPSGTACDPGQGQCATTCTVGAAGDTTCNGLIPGASCVPAGICTPKSCVSNADCGSGSCQFVGAACTSKDGCGSAATSASCSGGACATGTCTQPVVNCAADADCGGAGTCTQTTGVPAGTGWCEKKVDQAGVANLCLPMLVGAPTATTNFGGPVGGQPGIFRSAAQGIGFDNQQDNDPVRFRAVGKFNFAAVGGAPDVNPADQVASACGDLGVVLPISEPAIVTAADAALAFPATACSKGKTNTVAAVNMRSGAAGSRWSLCPNGDMPIGAGSWDAAFHGAIGGSGNCFVPVLANGTDLSDTRCLSGGNNAPSNTSKVPAVFNVGYNGTFTASPSAADGRAYNLHGWQAPSGGLPGVRLTQQYEVNNGTQPPNSPVTDSTALVNEGVYAAFYRTHTTRTNKGYTTTSCTVAADCTTALGAGFACDTTCPASDATCAAQSPGTFHKCFKTSEAQCTGGACCQRTSDTNQIGCLVEADPCTMGFAGLGAGEQTLTLASGALTNFAIGLNLPGTCSAGACTANSQCGTGGTCNTTTGACTAGACSTAAQCGTSGGTCSGTPTLNVSPQGPNDCIPAGLSGLKQYQIARDLFLGSIKGFDTLTSADINVQAQLALAQCMSGTKALTSATPVTSLIATAGFVNLPEYACCKEFTVASSVTSACPVPGTCSDGTCTADTDCGTSGTCSKLTCAVDADCGTGNTCASGTCTFGKCSAGACTASSGCGMASVGVACSSSVPCPFGLACNAGVCSNGGFCGTGACNNNDTVGLPSNKSTTSQPNGRRCHF